MGKPSFHDPVDRSQSGAILIMIAMMLIAIFGLAALAIELTGYSTSISQARNSANLAALAALEESTAGPTGNYLSRSGDRAQKVSGFNIIMGRSTADVTTLDQSTTGASTTGNATLIAGKYYYAKPDTTDPCNLSYPCFRPGVEAGARPSAFKVEGELFPPQTFAFAKAAFGSWATSKPIKVQSTATVVPRRGCFLVAGSPSNEIRATHLLDGADKAESAYIWDSTTNTVPDAFYGPRWAAIPDNRGGASPSSRYYTKHFKDDFITSSSVVMNSVTGVISDSDYNANPDFAKYHPNPPTAPTDNFVSLTALQKRDWKWDTFPSAAMSGYNGPEPMGTIFEGLKTAIESFQQRAVTGDEACIIFFQRNVRWPAVIKLTSDFDYLLKLVDPSKWGNRTQWIQNLYQHNIFPEMFSQTDMNSALAEAMREFDAERVAKPGMPSAEFTVLISDGIQTCSTCTPRPGPIPFDKDGDKIIEDWEKHDFEDCYYGVTPASSCGWADSNGDGFVLNDNTDKNAFDRAYADPANACGPMGTTCSNDYSNYVMGIQQVSDLVRAQYVPKKIPIHVIQIGPHVAPYSIDVATDPPQNPAKCMNEYEKRASGDTVNLSVPTKTPGCTNVSGVLTCDTARSSKFYCREPRTGCASVTPFTESNSFMYQIALMTNGLWAPIRPADSGCSGSEAVVGKCNPGAPVVADPRCRNTQDQMKDYMSEIMGQNPYTVVEQ